MKTMSKGDYIITKNGDIINKKRGNTLKPQLNGKGYLRVWIGKKLYFVHRLVAEKFIPNPNNLPQVNHKNGIKTDNRVENLEWVTNQKNREHAVQNGLHLSGDKCPWTKLTSIQVLEILREIESGEFTLSEIGKRFNVSRGTVADIKYGRTWKHLKRYADLSQIESDRNKG